MIEISDLYKYYGKHRAIGPIDANIEEGEIVGLLGLNGAGKTTILRTLACDLLPSGGSVKVGGLDVVEQPHEVRKRIGYLPDTPPLYDDMSVREYLRYAAALRGIPRTETAKRAEAAEDATALREAKDDPISSLSHGYRQRVGIAQAIVHNPSLVILDEPISGLDPVQIVEMRDLVRGLKGQHTVILSSHILGEISETCDRILMLGEGKIIASGTERELSERFSGATQVRLTLKARDAEKAAKVLSDVRGVHEVVSVAAAEPGDDVRSFVVRCTEDLRAELGSAVISAGFALLELNRAESDLENIFIRLAGNQQQEAA